MRWDNGVAWMVKEVQRRNVQVAKEEVGYLACACVEIYARHIVLSVKDPIRDRGPCEIGTSRKATYGPRRRILF